MEKMTEILYNTNQTKEGDKLQESRENMHVRPEHIIYTDHQIANMAIEVVNDHETDESHIAMNPETDQLMLVLRRSSAAEDEKYLRRHIDILRFDWLGILGYSTEELGFDEPGHPEIGFSSGAS
ncbi:MAG: hypothetical protein EOP06_28985 [Proteobacteria bacterium]|nr:MAG: hypothetical protein EOP06_28985 [Pseudomonadota bacterium]